MEGSREWFLFGLRHFALFEPVFSGADNQEELSALRDAAVEFSRAWLHSVVVELIEGRVRPEEALVVRRRIQEEYGLSAQDTATPEGAQHALDRVPAELHVEGILRVLAGLVDQIAPELSHGLKPLPRDAVVDWGWLRDHIVKLKKQKMRFPAIGFNVDGSIATTQLDQVAASHLAIPDVEKEVYVINNLGGVSFITIESWKDLAAGKLWRQSSRGVTCCAQ